MKKILSFILLFVSPFIYAFPVEVISDSPLQTDQLIYDKTMRTPEQIKILEDYSNIAQFYQNVQNTLDNGIDILNTVSSAYDTMLTQYEAISLMTEGDYVSFIQGLEAQAQTIGYFGDTMDGLNSDAFEGLRGITGLSSENLDDYSNRSDLLSNALYETTDLLWDSHDLVESTKHRLKTLKRLQEKSEDEGTLIAQLQLQNSAVQLMVAELSDVKSTLITANNATAAWYERELALADSELSLYEAMYQYDELTPSTKSEDLKEVVYGGNFK